MEIHETTKCPDCLSRDIVQDLSRGETHCVDCGLVIASDEIDQGGLANLRRVATTNHE